MSIRIRLAQDGQGNGPPQNSPTSTTTTLSAETSSPSRADHTTSSSSAGGQAKATTNTLQATGEPASSATTSSSSSNGSPPDRTALGATIGGVVGGLVLLGAIVAIIFWRRYLKQQKRIRLLEERVEGIATKDRTRGDQIDAPPTPRFFPRFTSSKRLTVNPGRAGELDTGVGSTYEMDAKNGIEAVHELPGDYLPPGTWNPIDDQETRSINPREVVGIGLKTSGSIDRRETSTWEPSPIDTSVTPEPNPIARRARTGHTPIQRRGTDSEGISPIENDELSAEGNNQFTGDTTLVSPKYTDSHLRYEQHIQRLEDYAQRSLEGQIRAHLRSSISSDYDNKPDSEDEVTC